MGDVIQVDFTKELSKVEGLSTQVVKQRGGFSTRCNDLAVFLDSAPVEKLDEGIGIAKAMVFEITKLHEPLIKAANALHKAALKLHKDFVGALTDALKRAEARHGAFLLLELRRQEQERQSQMALAAAEAQADREEQIAEAEAAGDTEAAEHLEETPVDFYANVPDDIGPAPELPKSTTVSYVPTFDFEIVNYESTPKDIGGGVLVAPVPREYCTPNESLIRATVRRLKGDTVIPGVRVFEVVLHRRKG